MLGHHPGLKEQAVGPRWNICCPGNCYFPGLFLVFHQGLSQHGTVHASQWCLFGWIFLMSPGRLCFPLSYDENRFGIWLSIIHQTFIIIKLYNLSPYVLQHHYKIGLYFLTFFLTRNNNTELVTSHKVQLAPSVK